MVLVCKQAVPMHGLRHSLVAGVHICIRVINQQQPVDLQVGLLVDEFDSVIQSFYVCEVSMRVEQKCKSEWKK